MKRLDIVILLMGICCKAQPSVDESKAQLYYIAEAPPALIHLWEHTPDHFKNRKLVKPHDNKAFAKWRQLKKLWATEKNESGHYEKKESIVITDRREEEEVQALNACREALIHFAITHLKEIEKKYSLPPNHLTMADRPNAPHTLRLLHYFDDAKVTAHCDTSILTCLYYRDEGLQLKINGTWIAAPKLNHNQMLVTYGVPGEILTDGRLTAVRHRVRCNERYAIAYFHNTPKTFVFPETHNYKSTTMEEVYQEAQLWYADVNARAVRAICPSIDLSCFDVIYGWLYQQLSTVDENPVAKKCLHGYKTQEEHVKT